MGIAKWIMGGLGWATLGPVGGIIGYLVGGAIDTASENSNSTKRIQGRTRTGEGDFVMSMLILSAAVMKADGKVLKSELNHVKDFLIGSFGREKSTELLQVLKELLNKSYPIESICLQIRSNMSIAERRHLFHYLVGIAEADGHVDQREQSLLLTIGKFLGISPADIASILEVASAEPKRSAYVILEIEPTASNDEVRTAYRKMAQKYHPDKVRNLGEKAVEEASKVFSDIRSAYDEIKKQRRM